MNRKNVARLAFGIVIICFVLSTVVSLLSLRVMAERNMQELSKSLASGIYDTLSGELMEPITVSRAMANDALLIRALKNEESAGTAETAAALAEYLSAQKNAFGYEAAFLVSDATMNYYSYGGVNKQMDAAQNDRDQWYAQFIASGREYELEVDRDEWSQDQLTVFVNTRVQDGSGRLLGVCGVGAHITGSQSLFVRLEKEYGVTICLVGREGLVQVATDEKRIAQEYLPPISANQTADYTFQRLGPDRFAVTKYIEKLGWYLAVESDGSAQRGEMLNMLLLNAALCAVVLTVMLFAIRVIISRTKALANASFVDQPTQLWNRRAFEEKKAALDQSALKEDFVYLTADLNGLKGVNDSQGHAAGDELIQGAAECLKACFGAYGDLYRIGGDEFAAMLALPEETLKKKLEALERITAAWSGQYVKGLSISCGYAARWEFPSENLSELSRISDERMYAAKDAYYRNSGHDRRRR